MLLAAESHSQNCFKKSHRVILDFFSAFEIPIFLFFLQSMSLNIDMEMMQSVNSSGSMLFLFTLAKFFLISLIICNDENPGIIFHSNSIASPSSPASSL